MLHLDQAELDRILSFPELVDSLRHAFAGDWTTPLRHHHGMPGFDNTGAEIENALLLMPAWTGPGSDNYIGVKLVAVYPSNGQVGLPSIHGLYYLIDGNTGQPLTTMDGARITLANCCSFCPSFHLSFSSREFNFDHDRGWRT